MDPIITSILDTDFQILAMGQFSKRFFSEVPIRYSFINRGRTRFPRGFGRALRDQVDGMADVRMLDAEYRYLQGLDTLAPGYVDWFRNYRFAPNQVHIEQQGGTLAFTIEGPWSTACYWQIPMMATVSELLLQMRSLQPSTDYRARAAQTARDLFEGDVPYAEYGSRRRAGKEIHRDVLIELMKFPQIVRGGPGLIGTSNVDFARLLDLEVVGTMPHETFMILAALLGDQVAGSKQVLALWRMLYGGKLSVALPDTFTSDMFFRDVFDYREAVLWDAVRQDSGVPTVFIDKLVAHYQKLGISPLGKTVVPSDSLNTEKAIAIRRYCAGTIQSRFGIGTYLTNNIGHPPPNIVVKPTAVFVNGVWVRARKDSDDPGKSS